MKHLLLANSFVYKKRNTIESPKGFIYDKLLGAWVAIADKSLLVKNESFPTVSTKKEDVETGEDQKGY